MLRCIGTPDCTMTRRRSLAAFVDDLSELPLAFQPGVRWHYGAGLDVAARLIEVIADQPLGAFLERAHLRAAGHGRHRVRCPR